MYIIFSTALLPNLRTLRSSNNCCFIKYNSIILHKLYVLTSGFIFNFFAISFNLCLDND